MKARIACFAVIIIVLTSCSSSKKSSTTNISTTNTYTQGKIQGNAFVLDKVSTDKNYGYSKNKPISVGGAKNQEGPTNQRRFLNALAGPEGQPITYTRRGSCCSFKSENGFMGSGLLDIYEISWEGLKAPMVLYINMYDFGELSVPVGSTRKLSRTEMM